MSSKYCCCGIHVHNGAFAVALICLILSILSLTFGGIGAGVYVNNRPDELFPRFALGYSKYAYGFTLGGLVESLVLFLTSAMLLYGNRARKPAFYWPFIVYAMLHLLFSLFRILFFAFVLFYAATQPIEGMSNADRQNGVLTLSVLTAFFALLFHIELYFVWVVVRARRFLVEERRIQKTVYSYPSSRGGWDPYYPTSYFDGRTHALPSYVYY